MRRVTGLGFEGFEGANGGSKLNSTVGVEGMDAGVSVELVGRDGEVVPRAAAIYTIERYRGCFANYLRVAMSLIWRDNLNDRLERRYLYM